MITEKELLRAMEECEREPVTAGKISKLADFYIVYDHLFGEPVYAGYSQAKQTEKIIEVEGDSEFLMTIDGKNAHRVWRLMDELIEAVKLLHPRMYDSLLTKLEKL